MLDSSPSAHAKWAQGWEGVHSTLNLGVRGSSAFLMTYNEWEPYSVTAATVENNFPEYAYVILARSRAGNVLMLWFTSAAGDNQGLLANNLALTKARAKVLVNTLS